MSAMPTPFFDTLRFAERLQSAGVPEPQARAEVEILRDIFAESLVTSLASKEDIRRLEVSTQEDFRSVREDIRQLKVSTKEDIRRLEASTREDFRSVREEIRQLEVSTKEDIRRLEASTKEDFRSVKEDIRHLDASTKAAMAALEQRMTIKLGSMLFFALGAFYTLTRLH